MNVGGAQLVLYILRTMCVLLNECPAVCVLKLKTRFICLLFFKGRYVLWNDTRVRTKVIVFLFLFLFQVHGCTL